MSATITDLGRYRAKRAAERKLQLSAHAIAHLRRDLRAGTWLHTCPRIGVTGMIAHGVTCRWCGAGEPTPPGAA